MKPATLQPIYINDRPSDVAEGRVLGAVMLAIGVGEKKGVAVAVNGTVVPRAEWTARFLAGGDRVLVIQATQGG